MGRKVSDWSRVRVGHISRRLRCHEHHVRSAIDRLGLDSGRGRGWRTIDWTEHGPLLVDELRRRGHTDVPRWDTEVLR